LEGLELVALLVWMLDLNLYLAYREQKRE